ncbi:hypothetical protein BDB00DRAFT_873153 [Zychaea mexicana]|uniref:uncharacterized protein n=1 Tax=Zychaea mexicana TaxID=64656 RepID=UPI0022FDFCD6|nr:uncharacterized protein BDB00DRAFT_873153 [Zychaea mexicana]KAI9492755.1 hypothetical protein BDB00DRAFT_873153 [Zychaea mexicana]
MSGIVNTPKTDKEVNMKKYIGEVTFSHLSNMIKSENYHNECVYNDKANDAVKQIFKEYEEGGIMAVRIYISEEKIKMLKAGEYDGSSVVLKIHDIFSYIFDMIQFDFQNRHSYMMSENESFARWQYVFRVLFQCTIIQVRTGEILSQATREEMKEENGGFRCKIDMLIVTHGKDGEENRVKLASNEHEEPNADGSSTVTPLAVDVMGLRGYLYGVYKHEDVFVAAKKSDKHIVLPTTLAEFEEFFDTGSIFLLLNYIYYIVSAAEEILQNPDKQTKRRFEAMLDDEYPVDDDP